MGWHAFIVADGLLARKSAAERLHRGEGADSMVHGKTFRFFVSWFLEESERCEGFCW